MTATVRQGRRVRALRLVVRFACLLAAAGLLWPAPIWPDGRKFVAGASPLVAVCSSLAARAVGIAAVPGLAMAALSLLRRRVFCRWVCPAGLLLDGVRYIGLRGAPKASRLPAVGLYAAILTLAGAVIGYPVLLWMDPQAMLSSAMGIPSGSGGLAGVLAGTGAAVMVLTALLPGNLWCARLCPLGGAQDLSAKVTSIVSRRRDRVPVAASSPQAGRGLLPARRGLLAGLAGAGLALWARRGRAETDEGPLRPPGAIEENRFTGLCVRCGGCATVCPSGIIRPDLGEGGLEGLMAPRLRFESDYCRPECSACIRACPSGALRPLDPAKKNRHIIGLARLDASICLMVQDEGECTACLRCCPNEAIRTAFDEAKYVSYPQVVLDRCNGCGACEAVCPVRPVRAIRVGNKGAMMS